MVDNNKSDETEMKTIDDTNETQNETQQRLESESDKSTSNTNDQVLKDTPKASRPFKLVSDDYINFVLGDSNAVRIHVKDPGAKNFSITGQKAADIKNLLDIAEAKSTADGKTVKRIVMHLGTNDVSKHKTDFAQVQLEVSTAINETHKKFPDAQIAFSSILPRKGKSTAIMAMNNSAKNVNDYIKKLAIKEKKYLIYIDNDLYILDKGLPIRALYDSCDI